MNNPDSDTGGHSSRIVWRALVFLAIWLVLAGGAPADLPAGAIAVVAATWTSLRLLPPGRSRLSLRALIGLVLRFFRQSLVAGADVAWRALDPRLPLQPGFVTYRPHLSPGPRQNAFCAMTSLLPGTLPCDRDESGDLVIHCLDATQPVVEQLTAEEARLTRALGWDARR